MAQVIYEQGVIVLELDAAYESLEAQTLQAMGELLLEEIGRAETPRVVLDMTQTRFIDSMFIETVFRAWKRIQELHGAMAICCANVMCEEVLKIAKLNAIWAICPSREEAIQVVRTN